MPIPELLVFNRYFSSSPENFLVANIRQRFLNCLFRRMTQHLPLKPISEGGCVRIVQPPRIHTEDDFCWHLLPLHRDQAGGIFLQKEMDLWLDCTKGRWGRQLSQLQGLPEVDKRSLFEQPGCSGALTTKDGREGACLPCQINSDLYGFST